MDEFGFVTHGIWDPAENAIIIKRSILKSKETFAGVLMHEFAHYVSGYADNTRDFENVLTEMLGFVYSELSIKGGETKEGWFVQKMVNSERGRNHYGSCLLLCLLMNKSTLKLATQAVATINLKGRNFLRTGCEHEYLCWTDLKICGSSGSKKPVPPFGGTGLILEDTAAYSFWSRAARFLPYQTTMPT